MGKRKYSFYSQTFKRDGTMKTNLYTYCTFKYQHSPFLDESLNIGVIIYFHNSQKFSFTYSKNLSRIKSAYSQVPEKTIREYIRQIDKKIKYFHNLKDDFLPLAGASEFSDFIYKNILLYDASCLKFAGFTTQSSRGFDDITIEETIINKVFIDDIKSQGRQPQEPIILQKLQRELKKLGIDQVANRARYQNDFEVKTSTGKFRFDFAWKNGVWNVVKPVGFDLKTGEGIIQKARNNLGEFFDFRSEKQTAEFKTTILVGKPESKDLFNEYTRALEILHKIPNTDIIEPSGLPSYAKTIIEAISVN